MKTFLPYTAGLLIIFAGIGCVPSVFGAAYGVNLIVNGDAEAGENSSEGSPIAIPNWTVGGPMTVVPYGAVGGFPAATDFGPSDRAHQFFAGGNGSTSSATQVIDLSGNTADINANKVTCDLAGWFGGYLTDNDNATLNVTFYNGSNFVANGPTIGGVTAFQRHNATGMHYQYENSIPVPPNTNRVVLLLTFTRAAGTFDDGYADSLSFVLRTPTVVTTAQDSGPGSLRAAIASNASLIIFDPSFFSSSSSRVITLQSALPDLSRVSIIGPGRSALTIIRSANAPSSFRIFSVSINGPVNVSGLTISGGSLVGQSGGGVFGPNGGDALGGGISNTGLLVLEDCWIASNNALGGTGAAGANSGNAKGGGIFSQRDLIMTNCTVQANTAVGALPPQGGTGGGGSGGGLYVSNGGYLMCNGCTFYSNSASGNGQGGFGGGLATNAAATFVTNCTIASNVAQDTGSGEGGAAFCTAGAWFTNCTVFQNAAKYTQPGGASSTGGIHGDVTVNNTIATASDNLFAGVDIDSGYGDYNFVGNGSFHSGQGTHNLTGDPKLDPAGLQYNGASTQTIALLSNSPAINAGSDALGPIFDQRGYLRNGVTDIGAYEYHGFNFVGSLSRSGPDLVVSAPGVVGSKFHLGQKSTLKDPAWNTVAGVSDIIASSPMVQFTVPGATNNQTRAFYSVVQVPK